jgi:hypothetical protein
MPDEPTLAVPVAGILPPPIPTPWIVGVHRYDSTQRTEGNKPIKAYNPPKSQRGQLFRAQGWGPSVQDGGGTEPQVDRSIERLTLLIPPVLHEVILVDGEWVDGDEIADPGPLDLIDLPVVDRNGVLIHWTQYEVKGWNRDYTTGPWLWRPGKGIDLERVTG